MFGRKLSSLKNKVKRKKISEKKEKKSNSFLVTGIVLTLIIGFIALVSPTIIAMLRFSPTTINGVENVSKWDYNEKFKILLVGTDKKSEEHLFIDGLSLLVVDPKYDQVGIININPDIVVNSRTSDQQISLRRAFIDNSGSDFLTLIEDLLATEIDRYVVIDQVYFQKMSKYGRTIQVDSGVDVLDSDVYANRISSKWQKGPHMVKGEQLLDYLKSDNNGKDEQLDRQLNIYSRYVQSIDPFKLLMGSQDVLSIVKEYVRTDLSRNEIYYLYYYLRTVPPSSYSSVFTKSDILTEVGQAGVYNLYRVNSNQLDHMTNTILENKNTVLEQTSVEVLNASGKSGNASQYARWIGNAGLEVVHVGNAPFSSESTIIYAPNQNEYQNSITNFRGIFGEEVEIKDQEYDYRHIGKVVVILGDN